MLHPSYTDLMKVVNEDSGNDAHTINSRYSIVMATSRRARQLVAGNEPLIATNSKKALSVAIEEFNQAQIQIMSEEEGMQ